MDLVQERLTVSGVKDHAGNTMASESHDGRVLGDTQVPTLLAMTQRTTVDPANGTAWAMSCACARVRSGFWSTKMISLAVPFRAMA